MWKFLAIINSVDGGKCQFSGCSFFCVTSTIAFAYRSVHTTDTSECTNLCCCVFIFKTTFWQLSHAEVPASSFELWKRLMCVSIDLLVLVRLPQTLHWYSRVGQFLLDFCWESWISWWRSNCQTSENSDRSSCIEIGVLYCSSHSCAGLSNQILNGACFSEWWNGASSNELYSKQFAVKITNWLIKLLWWLATIN